MAASASCARTPTRWHVPLTTQANTHCRQRTNHRSTVSVCVKRAIPGVEEKQLVLGPRFARYEGYSTLFHNRRQHFPHRSPIYILISCLLAPFPPRRRRPVAHIFQRRAQISLGAPYKHLARLRRIMSVMALGCGNIASPFFLLLCGLACRLIPIIHKTFVGLNTALGTRVKRRECVEENGDAGGPKITRRTFLFAAASFLAAISWAAAVSVRGHKESEAL